MNPIQTCLFDVCMCMYRFAHTYKINQLVCCLYQTVCAHKYIHIQTCRILDAGPRSGRARQLCPPRAPGGGGGHGGGRGRAQSRRHPGAVPQPPPPGRSSLASSVECPTESWPLRNSLRVSSARDVNGGLPERGGKCHTALALLEARPPAQALQRA